MSIWNFSICQNHKNIKNSNNLYLMNCLNYIFCMFALRENCPHSGLLWSPFPAFGLNTERYSVSLRIQSECGKTWTTITLNTDTFYAVPCTNIRRRFISMWSLSFKSWGNASRRSHYMNCVLYKTCFLLSLSRIFKIKLLLLTKFFIFFNIMLMFNNFLFSIKCF